MTVAVLEVNEEQWYTDNKAGALGGASLTRGYAPFPVFFEGWQSAPRAYATTYQWDFGDSSDYNGFNAAHVYETPGAYTCTLMVDDGDGNVDAETIEITVLARAGTTYYVDSSLGNDSNAGTATGASAWKTADKAFAGLGTNKYGPGDQILFKKGQTFDMSAGLAEVLGHFLTGSGWLFSTYGSGAKPVLKLLATGGSYNTVLYFAAEGMGHCTFQDLEIDCETLAGDRSDFFFHSGECYNLLFLRCDFTNIIHAVELSGGTSSRRQSGIFIEDCTFDDSLREQFFATSARVSIANSDFSHSGNHCTYLSYVDKGVITGNTFATWAFGRTALRIDGQASAHPTNNVQVDHNTITGSIDPIDGFPSAGYDDPMAPNYDPLHVHNGGGTRYNFYGVYFAPNAPEEQIINDITFEHNTVTNCERFMYIGDVDGLIVRNNTFSTVSDTPDPYRFVLGTSFDYRPLRNITFKDNTITSNEDRQGVYVAGIFGIFAYAGPAYAPYSIHTNIQILNNTIVMSNADGRFLYFDTDSEILRAQVFLCSNDITSIATDELIQIGGAWNVTGSLYDISDWSTLGGGDGCTDPVPAGDIIMALPTVHDLFSRMLKDIPGAEALDFVLQVNVALEKIWMTRRWRYFLSATSFDLTPAYTTGTVTVTLSSATVTGSGTTFTSGMVGRTFRLSGSSRIYTVATYVSATSITLDRVWSETTSAGATYSIYRDTYTLPSGFYALAESGVRNVTKDVALTPINAVDRRDRWASNRSINPATACKFSFGPRSSTGLVQIVFEYAPLDADTIHVDYYAKPTQAADMGDTLAIPDYLYEAVYQTLFNMYARRSNPSSDIELAVWQATVAQSGRDLIAAMQRAVLQDSRESMVGTRNRRVMT